MPRDHVDDEELRIAARLRMTADVKRHRETEPWIVMIAVSKGPIDRAHVARLRAVWEKTHGRLD